MECSVCTEKFNKTTRKPIECETCNYTACFCCVKAYFKSSELFPCCMSCKTQFSRKFIGKTLSPTFVKGDLLQFEQNRLFEVESKLLPNTQEKVKHQMNVIDPLEEFCVVEEKKYRDLAVKNDKLLLVKKNLTKSLYWYEVLQKPELNDDVAQHKFDELIEQRDVPHTKVDYLYAIEQLIIQSANFMKYKRDKISPMTRKIIIWYRSFVIDESAPTVDDNTLFIKQCPKDDCKGFLCSAQWNCGLCDVKVCKDCHEIKLDTHVCLPENVASADELTRSTKGCPGCGYSIHKILGCDQMWCTHCHVAFSWNTRKIIESGIHNPHFYEWQRAQSALGNIPREPGDILCGGVMGQQQFQTWCRNTVSLLIQGNGKIENWRIKFAQKFKAFHESVLRVERHEIPTYNNLLGNHNCDIRIKYLMEKIDIKEFKKLILMRHKITEKQTTIRDILMTYRDAGTDIMNSLVNNVVTHSEALDMMTALVNHVNEAFVLLSEEFGCSTRCIEKTHWSIWFEIGYLPASKVKKMSDERREYLKTGSIFDKDRVSFCRAPLKVV